MPNNTYQQDFRRLVYQALGVTRVPALRCTCRTRTQR